MTRAAAVLTLLALLAAFAATPVAGRQPEPAAEPVAEERGPDRRSARRAARIEAVIAAAESYLGLPYRIGREGPDIFDCSGLVFRIFADTGQVERIGSTRKRAAGYMRWFGARGGFVEDISLAERGDLVMYAAGKHIGIYLGRGKVISALVDGVTLHRIDGITLDVSGILKVDWTGPGGQPLPHPLATTPPTVTDDDEAPASLIPPLPWLEPLPVEPPEGAAPPAAETERVDMRTASSRTFQNDDGSFTTEIYGGPIFYLPPDSDEWLPIDLRFAARGDRPRLVTEQSPVRLELRAGSSPDGFIRLAGGGVELALGVPADAERRGEPALPALGDDGRFADYAGLLRSDIGLRVFPRADGLKAFLVLAAPLRDNDISFNLTGEGLTLAQAEDGSVLLLQAPPAPLDTAVDGDAGSPEPVVVGRIPRPLLLDSSDDTGDGRAMRVHAATLGVDDGDEASRLTISLDEAMLERAQYPLYVDLSIVDFPSAGLGTEHTFASSRYPTAVLHGYQRPEAPAHPELWHGRLPGTEHYNEAYLRFPALTETLGTPTLDAAALRFYPYWQYDLDGLRPTWVSRIAQEWAAETLSWDLRPAVDAELGRFETRAGQWSDIDVTQYVTDVLTGTLPDYGFRLHADGGGRGSWKRIVSDAGGTAEALPPRLVVTWRGLRPAAVDAAPEAGGVTLTWSHPAVAPEVTRYQVQLSTDGFATIAARHRQRGAAAAATSWTVPDGVIEAGVEYAWRVRARYGNGEPWSAWSDVATFVFGVARPEGLPFD